MAMRPPVGLPRLSKRSRILLVIGVLLLLGLVSGSRLLDTYIDWLWFGEVGYRSVFGTIIFTRLAVFAAVGVLVGGLVALNLVIAYRTRPVFVPVSGPDDPVSRYRSFVVSRLRLLGVGIPLLVGLVAAVAGQGEWQVTQLFLNATDFNVTDPEFGHDIGFYAFQLPFYRWLLSWAFVAVAVSFFGALVAHYLFGGIRFGSRGGGQLAVPARVQLAVLAGVFVLLKAVAYFLDRYELLSSGGSERFTGASYTDLHAVLPAKLILLCIAVFCAIAFFVGAFLRNLQLPAIAAVLLLLSSILVGAAWPAVLEQFSVKPNANEKEAASIERNIAATRQAFGLTEDKVTYEPYAGKSDVSLAEIKEDKVTVPNVRLLDPNALSQTFTQLQQRKNFYGFPAKLDIDRYTVNGRTQDYIVAAREINTGGLAENQRDWINRHLVYTHGNGFVAAPANTVNSALKDAGGEGGYPVFTVSELTENKDNPVSQGDIKVDQPRVYYGELVTDYAIVGAQAGEAPREYDTEKTSYTYTGKGGVPIGGWFNRLAFAASYGERNLLFSDAIGDNSKIIFERDPRDRVSKVAPWLTVDGDPYPAVVDGRIVWIVDGYTTLDNYPYAQRTPLGEATTDTLAGVRKQPNRQISYIRNSVKAVVDAYDGSVSMYAVDERDPVLKAWMGVFPGVVKPASEISPSLRSHFRYPEDLFKVQRELLSKYHVSNPKEFYSTVSFWDVPSDPTVDGQGQQPAQQPPYYVLAGNPRTGKVEFQLTSALVSLRREFMSAYVTVSSDPENYGRITVLQLPSDTQTKGPQQVQTQFVSSSNVSSELNLLRQQQTRVQYGNLLTLPVGGGLLYVEPVYIERSQQASSFPQLARVLVSFGGKVGYAATLAEALEQVFGAGAGSSTTNPGQQGQQGQQPTTTTQPPNTSTPPPPGGQQVSPELGKAVQDISAALEKVRKAQQAGDFAALGQAYKELDEATKRFEQARPQGGGGSSPSPSAAPPTPTPTR
ncbi:hypothetical protein LX15_003355 [Streptoalloteichus tenebrarius]|uniref:UPF0182 protein LX15_003355 n=1 Tax=Streptoalloteichus tenebrarius (strain ATCC 17920 / DSM 40477 / JCM 4838 / CBS 697.72 / NBRC 16177 / NCIMB 11028 / NRRL B-12390 / A12253. 1 / ISP 5477) TaxID=1933 RepID=A0ABT1HVV4_STRSD|nr:UPF0182 family protein [Streptoalloteichus tenebrarius]MCP2259650.1 hypothetical protein [Streptoalloteichus tenebrarius]BFF00943.1 UPF0182 family protein [Streptoalloteichus tenebrarius]